MTNVSYTQHAGPFTIKVSGKAGSDHCGHTSGKMFNITLQADLEFCGSPLDDKGFLIDNLIMEDFFMSLDGIMLSTSCEQLSATLGHQLCELAGNRGCKATVRVTPFTGVAISCCVKTPNYQPIRDFSPASGYLPMATATYPSYVVADAIVQEQVNA